MTYKVLFFFSILLISASRGQRDENFVEPCSLDRLKADLENACDLMFHQLRLEKEEGGVFEPDENSGKLG